MLEQVVELEPSFLNMETGETKKADCIRVDGAGDEGPDHEEVQFYWTERHIRSRKLVTMVTTRSSGSSYLNRVELQNGCLALGDANTFIPSTLGGSCMNPDSGQVDEQKLRTNMNLAIEAYISRVSGCPCGNTTIQLYRGADSSEDQVTRSKLLLFLKGSKKQKLEIQQENPELYSYFSSVWEVRNSHMVHGLPSHYMFLLYCCFQSSCLHPCCKAGKPQEDLRWYPDGPLMTEIPYPYPDPHRPGHYEVRMVDVKNKDALKDVPKPPSTILKEFFSSTKDISDDLLLNVSKKCLVPPEECRFWLDHLQTVVDNRRRGAKKAAETRRNKKSGSSLPNPRSSTISPICPPSCSSSAGASLPSTGSTAPPATLPANDRSSPACPPSTSGSTAPPAALPPKDRSSRISSSGATTIQHASSTRSTVTPLSPESTFCLTCGEEEGESEESEVWIGCDLCDNWYHLSCEGLRHPPTDEIYLCIRCKK